MTTPRPPKKSETLEIRLSHAEKLDFMARCRSEGVTASEVVRGMIEAPAARPKRSAKLWQALAAAMAGLLIGAVAAPSIAQALPGSRVAFDQMDVNHDGVISFAEFKAR
jgi:hypothetical protein